MTLNECLNSGREERGETIRGRLFVGPNPRVECVDGYSISIQCQKTSYCSPRTDLLDVSEYTAFELGFPNQVDELIEEFAEEEGNQTETVFPYVPREVVEALISKHGGIINTDVNFAIPTLNLLEN